MKMILALLFSLVSLGASAGTGMQQTASYKIWGVAVYRSFTKNFVKTYDLPVMGGTVTATYTINVTTVDYGSYGGLSQGYASPVSFTYTGSTYPIYHVNSVNSYLSQYYFTQSNVYRIRDSSNGYTIADFTAEINGYINGNFVNPDITSSFAITAVTGVP